MASMCTVQLILSKNHSLKVPDRYLGWTVWMKGDPGGLGGRLLHIVRDLSAQITWTKLTHILAMSERF